MTQRLVGTDYHNVLCNSIVIIPTSNRIWQLAFGFLGAIVVAIWLRVDVHENAFLPRSIDLLTIETHDLSSLLGNGTTTSVQLVQEYLRRIELDNFHGLQLRAVLNLSPREHVIAIAKMLDQERLDGRVRSSLHGLPVLVKVGERPTPFNLIHLY